MAHAQLEGSTDSGMPTLEQWLQEKKITQNLYNNLTKDDPSYTIELLLLMSQNDIKNLKEEFVNVRMPEILQLINLLKKMPDSQIYQDFHKEKQVIYLTPKQHETINQLKHNLTNISTKMENTRKSIEANTRECDLNTRLINDTFDKIIQSLNNQKLRLIRKITNICQNKNKLLMSQDSSLKKLYQTTLDIKNKYKQLTETIDLTTSEANKNENEMNKIIGRNTDKINKDLYEFDELMLNSNKNNSYDVKIVQTEEMDMMVGGMVKIIAKTDSQKLKDKVEDNDRKMNEKEIAQNVQPGHVSLMNPYPAVNFGYNNEMIPTHTKEKEIANAQDPVQHVIYKAATRKAKVSCEIILDDGRKPKRKMFAIKPGFTFGDLISKTQKAIKSDGDFVFTLIDQPHVIIGNDEEFVRYCVDAEPDDSGYNAYLRAIPQ